MTKTYINQPVGQQELEALVEIGRIEEEAFLARNPHLVEPYRGRLLATALCQGAALQFLRRGYGVNDFDLHYFYAQNPRKPRLSRAVRRISSTVGGFSSVSVDFIRTVVPDTEPAEDPDTIVRQLRRFLNDGATANAAHLAAKAVVALSPKSIFGVTIWPVA